jgi:3-deoxy-manno-octulosonate cytidylyltransferase (CMP-KDO synthetase)
MTSIDHKSGSDRSFEALKIIEQERKFEYIINLQGDMPFFDPKIIRQVAEELDQDPRADIATILAPLEDEDEISNPNVVNAVFNKNHHAMYFSRLPIPYSVSGTKANYFKHVGIYAYRRAALELYVSLPQSKLEISESLEQLRALENDMTIRIGFNSNVPISVDTPEDLASARNFIASKK